jgi:hypothetical protein
MNDITITIPLSLLSFLADSHFWVWYLNLGLLVLFAAICRITYFALDLEKGKRIYSIMTTKGIPTLLVLWFWALWPAPIVCFAGETIKSAYQLIAEAIRDFDNRALMKTIWRLCPACRKTKPSLAEVGNDPT